MHYAVGFSLPLVLAAVVCAQQAKAEPGQHAQTLEKQVAVKLNYLLYLPEGYSKESDKKWPLILFLHGSGERGSDVSKVKVHGVPKIVEGKKDFPFIVVSPQCPENRWWEPFELNVLLDDIMASYHVDADRVYLTGLSMGGFGTWDLAMHSPGRFAAIAPICGGGNPVMAFQIKNIPAWVFHGEADPVVPVQRSLEMVEALKKVKADVKLTTYPGVGHDSWTQTYDNPELYKWFLSHRRGEKAEVTGAGK
jgi:predicted peptidase